MSAAPPPPLRIVVADDQAFYRQGLARLLREAGHEVIAEAATGAEAVSAAGETAADVVVVELDMPGMSGTETTRRLTTDAVDVPVLVLSDTADEDDVADAILAGASGFVLKARPVDELLDAVAAVADGHAAFSPPIASMLLRWSRDRLELERVVPLVPLSKRELEILRLLADGRENHEIAEALFIGPGTVKNHVSSILAKLEVENRVQAAVSAVRGRLV